MLITLCFIIFSGSIFVKMGPWHKKTETLTLCNWYYVQILSKSQILWADMDAHLCRLYGTEPLPELKLYCQLNSAAQTRVDFITINYIYTFFNMIDLKISTAKRRAFHSSLIVFISLLQSKCIFWLRNLKTKRIKYADIAWMNRLLNISTAWQISNQPWSSKTPHAEIESLHRGKRWVLY